MTKKQIGKKKSTKKNTPSIKVEESAVGPKKQYTIFYTIGNELEFFIAHGTDYKLTTLDIKSTASSDMFSFPVVFVIDAPNDTLDMIPMSSVGNIRYNWGFQAEAAKYTTEFEALQKKMREDAEKNGEIVEGSVKGRSHPKKKTDACDVQYV